MHRTKVDENRALILANSIANGAAIRRLAQEPFERALAEISRSLEASEVLDDENSRVKQILACSLSHEYAKQQAEINYRVLALSEKLVRVNADLIEINKLSMELTAEIAIGSDPLETFEEACQNVESRDYDDEEIATEFEALMADCQITQKRAEENSRKIMKLNGDSEKNRLGILRNATSIHSVCDQVEALGATED